MRWFELNGRHSIPWKFKQDKTLPNFGESIPVYRIWIAEIMLQQTKLKVVLPYWYRWMKIFPSLLELVNADEQKVLIHWQGLGYYSRARRIKSSAKILFEKIGTENVLDPDSWPKNIEEWTELPGIGRSTAGSIISSAFDMPASILDGNVQRILSRLIASTEPLIKNKKQLWILSDKLLDKKYPRHFNQALMDLGAIVCTPRAPSCSICPWNSHCIAYASSDPTQFPVKEIRKSLPLNLIGIGIIFNADGEVLIDQRLNKGTLGGMWEFPGGKQEQNESIEITIAREIREELGIEVKVGEKLIALDHQYSNKKLHFVVHLCQWVSGEPQPLCSQKLLWVRPQDLSNFPFPAANTRIIAALHEYLCHKDA